MAYILRTLLNLHPSNLLCPTPSAALATLYGNLAIQSFLRATPLRPPQSMHLPSQRDRVKAIVEPYCPLVMLT